MDAPSKSFRLKGSESPYLQGLPRKWGGGPTNRFRSDFVPIPTLLFKVRVPCDRASVSPRSDFTFALFCPPVQESTILNVFCQVHRSYAASLILHNTLDANVRCGDHRSAIISSSLIGTSFGRV